MAKGEHKPISERKKEITIQSLWLTYYTDTAFAKGLISESERNKLRVAIKQRAAALER